MVNEQLEYPSKVVTINSILFLCFFLATITILLFAMKVIREEIQLKYQVAQYETMKEYIINLETSYKEYRSFQHDYLNMLSTLNLLIEEKHSKDYIKDYFNYIVVENHMTKAT